MGFRLSFNTISFVLILVSFVFLLLATISSPVVTTFNLGKTATYSYGLFGYCWENNSKCSSATYPIDLASVDDSSTNWVMSSSTRNTLAKIFIITPIALGFNFITLIIIAISHFIGFKKAILFAIVINVISLILTIISCIVTILAFYPNLAWTGWILIGSAAANIVSLVFLIVTLTVIGDNDSTDDDNSDADDSGLGFGRLNNYDKLDDKFNHIQTSTFKSPNSTSSIDNEYAYKPFGTTNTNNNAAFNTINPINTNTNTNTNKNLVNNSQTTNAAATSQQSGYASNTYGRANLSGPAAIAAASASASASASAASLAQRNANGSFGESNSSAYFMQPQTANDFTMQRQNGTTSATTGSLVGSNVASSVYGKPNVNIPAPYPITTPLPNNSDNTPNAFSRSVFEHHPQVEGHKPFTELDDDNDNDNDDEDDLGGRNIIVRTNNDSDEDSDFTSVSQRAPNPQYNGYNSGYVQGGYYPQQQQQQQQPSAQYSHVQQYQPIRQQTLGQPPIVTPGHQNHLYHQQQQQQQQQQHSSFNTNMNHTSGNGYFAQSQLPPSASSSNNFDKIPPSHAAQQRPTISDNVLSNNPDFAFSRGGVSQQKRRVQPGFVPVASRYKGNNSTNQASAMMGRGGGADAPQVRSGPYGITR